jgi:integrase
VSLNEITIRNLKPAEKQQTVFDSTLSGFGVRVSPGGTKTFILVHGKRRERTTLGRYGTITLAQARAKAKELLAQQTLGQHLLPTLNFEEAYELFKQTHIARKKLRTQRDYKRVLERHFLPKLRLEKLETITVHVLSAIIDRLIDTPSEMFHAQSVSRNFFRWCIRRRYIKQSPLEGMQIEKQRPRERILSDPELIAVWRAAEEIGFPFGNLAKLCILLGQRRTEIGSLEWGYINAKQRTITLPPTLTKNSRQHTIPHGDMTAALLEEIPRLSEIYLFPARGKDTPFNGWSESQKRLTRTSGFSDWVLHDLRRTFATNLAALGTPIHVTEKLLNHISGTTSGLVAIYQRYAYLDEMRTAVEKWEAHLSSLLKS